jgi:hypothetical protein
MIRALWKASENLSASLRRLLHAREFEMEALAMAPSRFLQVRKRPPRFTQAYLPVNQEWFGEAIY